MTDKSMIDILSKFNNAATGIVNESATATRSRSSSAGDPAMHDILSKFYGAVQEAGVDTSVPAGDKNKAFDKLDDTHFDQTTGDADVMSTPSYGGYQATKNMKTGDVTQNYSRNGMKASVSQDAQGNVTRQTAGYKMGDIDANMAQAGDEQFIDVDQRATDAGVGGYASAYDAGDGNMQNAVVGQVGSMDQTATSVSSDASGNTNAYMSDRDTSNMIKQQEKDIARLQTDKLFNDVNEDENDMPASDEEASMAGDQAEYIKYAIDEIKDSIEAGNSFPEWFQNKLAGVYTTLKDLHGYMEGDKRNDAEDEVVEATNDFKRMDFSPDGNRHRVQTASGIDDKVSTQNGNTTANRSSYSQSKSTDLDTGKEVSGDTYADYKDGASQNVSKVAAIVDPARDQAQIVTHGNGTDRNIYQADAESGAAVRDIERSYAAMQHDQPELDDMFDDVNAMRKLSGLAQEDVVSKKQAAADVVGKKTAVDDIVQELSKSYADFVAQVEEERDDMSFFKKDKKR